MMEHEPMQTGGVVHAGASIGLACGCTLVIPPHTPYDGPALTYQPVYSAPTAAEWGRFARDVGAALTRRGRP